jgi:trimethylamine--corrinoid protein Co-methyltransferase
MPVRSGTQGLKIRSGSSRGHVTVEAFTLNGGLTEQQIRTLHEKALFLIEKVGIHIPHRGILDILSSYQGVKLEKERVTFDSDLVLKALIESKYVLPEYARDKDDWVVSSGVNQTKYHDLDTGEIREPLEKDLIELTKLCDSLDTVGAAPVKPMDVPVYLQEILMHKISYEYSRYKCNDIFEIMDKSTVECANYIYNMAQAAGKWFTFGIWMISPRTFDRKNLEVAFRLLDRGIPMWISTMPVTGVSAPITIHSALLQSMFEHLAGLTMLSLINTKSYNYISPNDAFEADPFDMRYATFVYGSAEYARITLHKIALCRHYGIPVMAKTLLTAAKEPDAQAAFEIGSHTLLAALAGARAFRCAGLLNHGELYSAEMVVLVMEIVEYIKNTVKGEEFDEQRLMVDEIRSVRPGQSHIGRKSTFMHFRDEYWEPALFTHSNLGQWIEMGRKSIREYARELVKKKIKEHTYRIDRQVKRELDDIYECAVGDERLKKSFDY